MENQTPTPQSTTTMRTFTFDGMPVALASLHEKCDTIIALLSTIASSGSGAAMHTPIGMTEASKLLGKSPSTIYDMTSQQALFLPGRTDEVDYRRRIQRHPLSRRSHG